ncbi:hypothetical protein TBLA_0C06550 [Henningerozyma blattae CBS 6284]|uniref:Uncharacterized protein n=1 Tax=Henningerozyma blattae (strain ATCC 34711 / CBS 6284 / DSM 70876 / NBRC 10599 / NRRL Y-10934 / UCD 77-7) TaxID=1071380 RepID=I2H246_HENB6|nr:hypothetical protein TBLA_0C06550 [Tetrapisispora blattae CBS 6284]CCH60448.1 hypothetical protein TBLA_0C06550 [Tetrapisispora blattae CBS 6284]
MNDNSCQSNPINVLLKTNDTNNRGFSLHNSPLTNTQANNKGYSFKRKQRDNSLEVKFWGQKKRNLNFQDGRIPIDLENIPLPQRNYDVSISKNQQEQRPRSDNHQRWIEDFNNLSLDRKQSSFKETLINPDYIVNFKQSYNTNNNGHYLYSNQRYNPSQKYKSIPVHIPSQSPIAATNTATNIPTNNPPNNDNLNNEPLIVQENILLKYPDDEMKQIAQEILNNHDQTSSNETNELSHALNNTNFFKYLGQLTNKEKEN